MQNLHVLILLDDEEVLEQIDVSVSVSVLLAVVLDGSSVIVTLSNSTATTLVRNVGMVDNNEVYTNSNAYSKPELYP